MALSAMPSGPTGTGSPKLVPSSENCTVPTGVVSSTAVTFAVKVTSSPYVDGFCDDVTTVVVSTMAAAAITVCVIDSDMLPL